MIGKESEEASADWKSHGPLTQLQESEEDTKTWPKTESGIKTEETLQTLSQKKNM